jgi:maleamate amidohydrolase
MAVWDKFLTDDDRKVLAARKARKPHGPGKKNALLLVDMQVTACGYDKPIWEQLDEYSGACGPHAWKSIAVQQKLLAVAHATGTPVIYSKHITYPYMGMPAADPSNNFSSLNPNSEIPVEVKMEAGDILVEKQTPSCFAFTNLQLIARHNGIDGFLVGGNSTSGCVRATIVDGENLGFKMSCIEEATFDRIELSHAAALFDMQFKYCDVISAADALAIMEGATLKAAAE